MSALSLRMVVSSKARRVSFYYRLSVVVLCYLELGFD